MAEKGKEKVTMMKLKVDLDCAKCYKKVKKVLCKFPQIRDQLFDEKSKIVIIKVVCCSPEKIMDKLCSKAGGSINSIQIIEPPKPHPPQPQAQPPQKPKAHEKPKELEKSKEPKEFEKQPGQPPQALPISMCCGPYYEGDGGGPSFNGYGMLLPEPYECYGRPVYNSWGGGPPPHFRQCHLTRCDYLSEENPQSCSIM